MDFFKKFVYKISIIGIKESDTETQRTKKSALTLLPFYISIPAIISACIYLYLENFKIFFIPLFYITISILAAYYLYKTKKFLHFEIIQLSLILVLPFILMWLLGGFAAGSFVFIWAFYAPIAAAMYSENIKVEITWFSFFILLLFVSTLIDAQLIQNIDNGFPILVLDIFFFLNIGAGLGGIYFLVSHFINKIKNISTQLKRDRESLYNLTNDLKSVNKELEHLANSDVVTNLPNRLYFIDMIEGVFNKAKINNKKVAIMFLDLDGFKAVNDTLGHEAGDMILKVVGSRLSSIVRISDTVARVGGDEFAISLSDISDTNHVEYIAKTIIQEINKVYHYNGEVCRVGISIGISFYPDNGTEIEDLMQKADQAMYITKKDGKNNFSIYK